MKNNIENGRFSLRDKFNQVVVAGAVLGGSILGTGACTPDQRSRADKLQDALMDNPAKIGLALSAAETAVAEPVRGVATATPAATEVARSSVVALKYDEEGFPGDADKLAKGDPTVSAELKLWLSKVRPGQSELAAWPIRRAQEVVLLETGVTDEQAQQAMTKGTIDVQNLAAAAGIPSMEGEVLDLPFGRTYLVWCANAKGANLVTPADAAKPYGDNHRGSGEIWTWAPPAHYEKAPDPRRTTFKGCAGVKFWAVPIE